MEPIRPTSGVPPRGPSTAPPAGAGGAGAGAGRHGGRDESASHGAAPGGPGAPPARRRGSVPHRVGLDLERAAGAVAAGLAADDPAGPVLDRLLDRLALDPLGGGEALRAQLGPVGAPLRVALLAAAAHLRPPDPSEALELLARRVLEALPGEAAWVPRSSGAGAEVGPGEPPPDTLAVARAALTEAAGEVGRLALVVDGETARVGVGREFLVQVAGLLVDRLDAALGRGAAAPARLALAHALRAADGRALARRLAGPALGALLAAPREAPLRVALVDCALTALNTGAVDARVAALCEAALAPGHDATRALAQLVGALEAEASANAARRVRGEPASWSLPLREGERVLCAQLQEDARPGAARLAVGLGLSALGDVRADLVRQAGRVVLRLTAAEPTTAALLRAAEADLRAALAAAGDDVVVAVATGDEGAARVPVPQAAVDHLDING